MIQISILPYLLHIGTFGVLRLVLTAIVVYLMMYATLRFHLYVGCSTNTDATSPYIRKRNLLLKHETYTNDIAFGVFFNWCCNYDLIHPAWLVVIPLFVVIRIFGFVALKRRLDSIGRKQPMH